MKIVREGHPALKTVCEPFDFANPQHDPVALERQLSMAMFMEDGAGLAANQIGVAVRAFVMVKERGLPVGVGYFNPEILSRSNAQQVGDEGCLSHPGLYVRIPRAMEIEARWFNAAGEAQHGKFSGFLARCFQHECDHLDGKTLIDVAAPMAVLIARKKLMQRQQRKGRRR